MLNEGTQVNMSCQDKILISKPMAKMLLNEQNFKLGNQSEHGLRPKKKKDIFLLLTTD